MNASAASLRRCEHCSKEFQPRRAWARYCSAKCRSNWHAEHLGLRGVVASVRVMRRGTVSIVIRVGIEDRAAALALEPGKIIEVMR